MQQTINLAFIGSLNDPIILAAVGVGGGRAQVPQNALNDATVTAAVSHQPMLRPVRARDACRENATRLALLGEGPERART